MRIVALPRGQPTAGCRSRFVTQPGEKSRLRSIFYRPWHGSVGEGRERGPAGKSHSEKGIARALPRATRNPADVSTSMSLFNVSPRGPPRSFTFVFSRSGRFVVLRGLRRGQRRTERISKQLLEFPGTSLLVTTISQRKKKRKRKKKQHELSHPDERVSPCCRVCTQENLSERKYQWRKKNRESFAFR